MFREIFVKLLQERQITTYKLTKDTGISNGLITGWTQGDKTPSGDNLLKLAAYFHVSTDYLLGNTDDPSPPTQKEPSPDEKAQIMREGLLGAGIDPDKLTDEEWDRIFKFIENNKEFLINQANKMEENKND